MILSGVCNMGPTYGIVTRSADCSSQLTSRGCVKLLIAQVVVLVNPIICNGFQLQRRNALEFQVQSRDELRAGVAVTLIARIGERD